MAAIRDASICVLIAVLLVCATVAYAERPFGYTVSSKWKTLTARSITQAEFICAGKVLSSRRLEGAEPWWNRHRSGKDLEAHEAEFQVDHVIRGPEELAGTKISIQFVGSNAERPSFVSEMKERRTLICATKQGPGTFRLLFADKGSFVPAGPKPDIKTEKTPTADERMDWELASALTAPERVVRTRTLRYVGRLNLSGPKLVQTLVAMRDDLENDLALQATSALVRMGHRETLLAMDELLALWKAKGVNAGKQFGQALRGASAPESVPLLIRMLSIKENNVREGAAFALRMSRSPNAMAALAGLLDDPNLEIRFSAVNGLYRQANLPRKWLCNIDEFKNDPDTWTTKWKGWWEKEGKTKFPSVEQVLKQAEEGKGR